MKTFHFPVAGAATATQVAATIVLAGMPGLVSAAPAANVESAAVPPTPRTRAAQAGEIVEVVLHDGRRYVGQRVPEDPPREKRFVLATPDEISFRVASVKTIRRVSHADADAFRARVGTIPTDSTRKRTMITGAGFVTLPLAGVYAGSIATGVLRNWSGKTDDRIVSFGGGVQAVLGTARGVLIPVELRLGGPPTLPDGTRSEGGKIEVILSSAIGGIVYESRGLFGGASTAALGVLQPIALGFATRGALTRGGAQRRRRVSLGLELRVASVSLFALRLSPPTLGASIGVALYME
jgi:hypothetical protein